MSTRRTSNLAVQTCGACGSAAWTATYRAQVERVWSVSADVPLPRCDYEDEDFGEWDAPQCVNCGLVAPDSLRERIMDALTRT